MESLRSSTWGPFGGTNCARAETIRHGPPRGRHYQSCLWLPRACRPAVLLAVVGLGLHAQSAGSITMSGLPQGGIAVIDAQQNVYIAGGGGCAGLFATEYTPIKHPESALLLTPDIDPRYGSTICDP